MENNIIIGLSGIGGTIIGYIFKSLSDYLYNRQAREDKYFFALLEKRFEAYQKAFPLTEDLKRVIHKQNDEKDKVINEAKEWFFKHNLYLYPAIRKQFQNIIQEVDTYSIRLENYKQTGQQEGWETDEVEEQKKELKNTFTNIMAGIQKQLQEDLDKNYYKYLKKT